MAIALRYGLSMDWAAPLSTALGAAIGVGSTLLAERSRWRRQTTDTERETLRALYADFLTALSQALDQIWQASRRRRLDPAVLEGAAQSALNDHQVYPRRFQLTVSAPESVAVLAKDAVDRLVAYRDLIVDGTPHADPRCREARRLYSDARDQLIAAMRATLPHAG
ncbi:hypothetical protein [Kitasatospora sp. NBC_00315]|uniref:hypothetical protein n=1 Tax=Kitasatospora sp. NBC_00315 TaxID=2975963 RepID=UPI0032459CCD